MNPSTQAPAVELCGLRKTFGDGATMVVAVDGVDLSVEPGTFVAVMGPSGSGKSTLLHLMGGLDAATGGTVLLGGEDLASLDEDALTMIRRRKVGFVFQFFNLISVLTASENVALPLLIDGVPEPQARQRAREMLALVGIEDRAEHLPGALSGGEQQRAAIARSLITKPVLLLADEPTGNLDSRTGDQVMRLLRRVVDDEGQTVVMVTHDAQDAAMADRIVRLEDGRIVEDERLIRPRGSSSDVLAGLEDPS